MESSDTNNTRSAVVTIGPDLYVSALIAPARAGASGDQISVTDTTANKEGSAAGASTTAFFLSLNTTLDAGDYRLTPSRPIQPLAPGQSSIATTTLTLPTVVPGTWYLIANADDANIVPEPFEANNAKYDVDPTRSRPDRHCARGPTDTGGRHDDHRDRHRQEYRSRDRSRLDDALLSVGERIAGRRGHPARGSA